MKIENQQSFRIGILGGMGPMAGVYLQQLIIEATPVRKDQDHLGVVCFTNPHIADRTQSLVQDNGRQYISDLETSAQILVGAGATILAIPCNTAHARFRELQSKISIPIVNMVELAVEETLACYTTGIRVGLLATDGTLTEKIYQRSSQGENISWVTLGPESQKAAMRVIYGIKAGEKAQCLDVLRSLIKELKEQNAQVILLGCTELSLCFNELRESGCPLIDPLRILAKYLVSMSSAKALAAPLKMGIAS